MGRLDNVRNAVKTDHTLLRASRDGARAARALPSAAAHYVLEKAPIVHWLPKYNPRWLINDVLAGITVGVMLIPQSLAYAKIATISGEFGLYSSWLPNFLYFIMGTSKDMSTGPTSLMGLLTAEIIRDVVSEGFTKEVISSAVAMGVGLWCLLVGLFKLGFLLEFVSIPVLNGFISATGIIIMLGQIDSLLGIDTRSGTANIIHDIFAQLPQWDPATLGIGFGGIFLLVALQKIGQRWGKKSKIIWLIALARAAIVLVLFTGISYGVNKDVDLENEEPKWALSEVESDGIQAPKMPPPSLIGRVFARAIAPFIAAAIEHLAIAKSFGRKNGYVIDPAQELVYLGVTNFFNSFFGVMPVGGAMSRTAVNSETGVKSPTYGLVAGGVVILAIFKLSPALFWLPKATLSAIIIVAVVHVIHPPSTFYAYWKTSLVDFITSMLAFWITLFVNTETGIGCAVGFNLVYHILCIVFSRVKRQNKVGDRFRPVHGEDSPQVVPDDSQVFKLNHSIIFCNAFFIKNQCFDVVQTYNSGEVVSLQAAKANRNWSVSGEQRLNRLRKRAGIDWDPISIQVVVLDFAHVATIDTTGLVALKDFRGDIENYGGKTAELRFVNVRDSVKAKFERFGWELYDAESISIEDRQEKKGNALYKTVEDAVREKRPREKYEAPSEGDEVHVIGDEKA